MGVGKDLWTEGENGFNKGDVSWVGSSYASDAVFIDPFGRYEGPEAILAYYEAGLRAFPDNRMETSLLVEDGDTVVAEWTTRGTQTGPLAMPDGTEIPATGKTVEIQGVSVVRVKEGKVTSHRDYFDNIAVMSQLGLMPNT
jgi:steroid delta-isomerase-like uncharacterized protein